MAAVLESWGNRWELQGDCVGSSLPSLPNSQADPSPHPPLHEDVKVRTVFFLSPSFLFHLCLVVAEASHFSSMTEEPYRVYRLRCNPSMPSRIYRDETSCATATPCLSVGRPDSADVAVTPSLPKTRAAGSNLYGSGVTVVTGGPAYPTTTTTTTSSMESTWAATSAPPYFESRPYCRPAPKNCRATTQHVHLFATGSVRAKDPVSAPASSPMPLTERPVNCVGNAAVSVVKEPSVHSAKQRRQDMLRGNGRLW